MTGTSNQPKSAIPLLEHIDDRLTGCERWSFSPDNERSADDEGTIFFVSLQQFNQVFTNTFVERNNPTTVTLWSLIGEIDLCVYFTIRIANFFPRQLWYLLCSQTTFDWQKKMVWFLKPFLPFRRWLDTIWICDLLSVFDCFPSPILSPNRV